MYYTPPQTCTTYLIALNAKYTTTFFVRQICNPCTATCTYSDCVIYVCPSSTACYSAAPHSYQKCLSVVGSAQQELLKLLHSPTSISSFFPPPTAFSRSFRSPPLFHGEPTGGRGKKRFGTLYCVRTRCSRWDSRTGQYEHARTRTRPRQRVRSARRGKPPNTGKCRCDAGKVYVRCLYRR